MRSEGGEFGTVVDEVGERGQPGDFSTLEFGSVFCGAVVPLMFIMPVVCAVAFVLLSGGCGAVLGLVVAFGVDREGEERDEEELVEVHFDRGEL